MTQYLKCNKCGVEYHDTESIEIAKDGKDSWTEICTDDGVFPIGIAPCAHIQCKGELVLTDAEGGDKIV